MSVGKDATAAAAFPWEQGSLLPAGLKVLPLQWVHPAAPATRVGRGAVTAARRRGKVDEPITVSGPGKNGDRMIVITQSCDLIKPAEELAQLEVARVFATEKARTIAQAQDFGSARYFRLNDLSEDVAIVLDYGQRALLEKGFLDAAKPDNSLLDGMPSDRRRNLARWLGQRYSRPAIPDEDYEQITRPVRQAWLALLEEEGDAAIRFNREYAEWRYRREDDGSLTLFILSPQREPDVTTALEVSDFLAQALEPMFPAGVRVATDHRSYHTFTKADELSSEQIFMDWASTSEGDEEAALPSA